MAGLIPQDFIDNLLDRADIVDVVGSRVPLRKAGKNYSACCPFHEEKTPSFTVSPDKQFYYCFGCGAGGNSIGFLMDFENIGFVDAVESLAKRLGLEVPREQGRRDSSQYARLYALLEKASNYYRTQLRKHPKAKEAISYLKGRGLSGEIANEFAIGFAPPGWDNLLKTFGDADGDNRLLERVGLVIENPDNKSTYDRFRNRIMFPIRDVRGRVIGFGGRVLGDEKPKYLNSPETPVFHKGRELYGLYEANRALSSLPSLLVVEGYMDVVALAQFDIRNAVATLGTAATEAHLEKAFRYTAEIIFCFDGDAAGRKAARRALENALPVMIDGRAVKFLFLPEGEDPDTRVRKLGKQAFLKELAGAQPLSEFIFAAVSEEVDISGTEGKARLKELAAPLINKLPEGVFKELMLKELSRKTDIDAQVLRGIIAPPTPEPQPYSEAEAGEQDVPPWGYSEGYPEMQGGYPEVETGYSRESRPQSRPRKLVRLSVERLLIALLLNNSGFAGTVQEPELLAALEDDDIKLFLQLLELLRDNPEYTINHILGYWRGVQSPEQAEALARIAAIELLHPDTAEKRDDAREFANILGSLYEKARLMLPPLTLLEELAGQESITEPQIKQANSAWRKLSADEKKQTGNALLSGIMGKPRQ